MESPEDHCSQQVREIPVSRRHRQNLINRTSLQQITGGEVQCFGGFRSLRDISPYDMSGAFRREGTQPGTVGHDQAIGREKR